MPNSADPAPAADLLDSYLRSLNPAILDQAIQSLEAAYAAATADVDTMMIGNDLGIAYRHRFESRADQRDLRRAVDLHANCLRVIEVVVQNLARDPTSPEQGVSAEELDLAIRQLHSSGLNNLGFDHRLLFQTTGLVADLDLAIDLLTRAVQVAPDAVHESQARNNLSACLLDQFHLTRDPAVARKAAKLLEDADPPTDPVDGAWWHTNYANAVQTRAELEGQPSPPEVIEHYRAAWELSRGRPHLAQMTNNYAAALIRQGAAHGQARDLVSAVSLLTGLLAQDELGAAYRAGFLTNLALAYVALSAFVDFPIAAERAARAYQKAAAAAMESLPTSAVSIGYNWGSFGAARHDWVQAAAGYTSVLSAMRLLFAGQWSREDKQDWLARASLAPALAAEAHARSGDAAAAALALESGRALLMTESLEQRTVDLGRLADEGRPDLSAAYAAAAQTWSALVQRAADAVSAGVGPAPVTATTDPVSRRPASPR